VVALTLMIALACSSGGQATTTSPAGSSRSPEAVAELLVAALTARDPELAAANTIEEQMAWLAMAEGASLQEASALLDDGARSIAVNYWRGFIEQGDVPPVAISSINEVSVGSHTFARVSLGGEDDLHLVLRSEPEWKVDVVASFGSTLVERLADAAEIVFANAGPGARRLREVLGEQRDSVDMATSGSGLNETARAALVELAEALEQMSP
jgi:hypothetical protein